MAKIRDAVEEEHEICAVRPCTRDKQSVELQEMRGCGDRLRSFIIEALVFRYVNTQSLQRVQLRDMQRPFGSHADTMDFVLEPARPNRLQRQSVADLCQCAIALEARVQNLELAVRTPSTMRARSSKWLPALPGYTPRFTLERLRIDRVQRIEDRSIVNALGLRHGYV
jgi:hypothetical protein